MREIYNSNSCKCNIHLNCIPKHISSQCKLNFFWENKGNDHANLTGCMVFSAITTCINSVHHAHAQTCVLLCPLTMDVHTHTHTCMYHPHICMHPCTCTYTRTPSLTLQFFSAASSGVSYLPHNGLQSGLKNMAVLLKKLS